MLRRLIKMMYVNDMAWNRLMVDYCGFFFFFFLLSEHLGGGRHCGNGVRGNEALNI